MGPQNLPYPSFTLVLSQNPCPMRLPAYKIAHLTRYHPYPKSRTSRTFDFDDPFMRTVHTPYNGPRLDGSQPTAQEEEVEADDDDTMANLSDAISKGHGGNQIRQLTLSTLVIDLAFAVRGKLQWLDAMRK